MGIRDFLKRLLGENKLNVKISKRYGVRLLIFGNDEYNISNDFKTEEISKTLCLGKIDKLESTCHPSVGISSKILINPKFFTCDRSSYLPTSDRKDCGGDNGKTVYMLAPIKRGKTRVFLIKIFRSEVTNLIIYNYRIK